MALKLGIVGSRGWPREEEQRVIEYVRSLPPDTVVVTGGWPSRAGGYHVVEATSGIDRIAYKAAEAAGLVTCLVSGSQTRHGHMAGVQRNPVIADIADGVTAFWDGESRGTARTLTDIARLNKQALVIAPGGAVYEPQHWAARAAWVLSPKG